jgi:tRNA U34 5-methylaminomethyl-2-thiouridine-forming methyltransferase MnmC
MLSLTTCQYEIVKTSFGAVSILDKNVNEIMHNPVGPWVEANELYINQSQLRDRLLNCASDSYVVFDVGLGAAANSLAVLHAYDGLRKEGRKLPRLKIVSFEQNLELLKFALQNSKEFSHFSGYEIAIEKLISTGKCHTDSLEWILCYGNFLNTIEQASAEADVVYYDPYSPKVNSEMWTVECFEKLKLRMKPNAILYTYSQSTPVRVALILAGYFVGIGTSTGFKLETTQASRTFSVLKSPLGKRWLSRWQNSRSQLPYGWTEDRMADVKAKILNHDQMSGHASHLSQVNCQVKCNDMI